MKISQKTPISLASSKKESFCSEEIFYLLSNIYRFRIFWALTKHPELTSQDIYNILKISKSLSARHLDTLEAAQVLLKKKRNNLLHYSLNRRNCGVKTAMAAFASIAKI